jgi:hypothetical protein
MGKQIISIGDTGEELIAKLANNFTLAIDNGGGLFGVTPIGVNDQVNIQAMVDSAAGVRGTVKIASGNYVITDPVVLKSEVSIEIEDGAIFNFPQGYDGVMWTNDNKTIRHCRVSGGRYIGFNESNPLWDCVSLIGTNYTTSLVTDCRFKNMWIQNARNGFYIGKTGTGWVDGNKFSDIFIWNCINGIYGSRSLESGGGIDINSWSDLMIQASANTQCGIQMDTRAAYWTFTNILLIDFIEGQVPYYFGPLTENFIFHGTIPGPLPARHAPCVSLGLENYAMTNKTLEINKRLINKQISASLTDPIPTAAELDAAIGITAAQAGAGSLFTIKDNNGSSLCYKVESDGVDWMYLPLIRAL